MLIWVPLAIMFTLSGPSALPSSDDIPSGPPEAGAAVEIGGSGMLLSEEAVVGEAVISMMSETVGADETLVATGQGLDGVTWCYAPDGQWPMVEATPEQALLGTAGNRGAVVLPDNPVLNATTLVFAKKEGVYSAPFRINGPRIFWTSPASVRRINGDTFGNLLSVYGKNLQFEGVTNYLYLSGPDRAEFIPVLSSPHENLIQCMLPTNLMVGTYSLWAHNGTGRSHGWSDPVTFSVYLSAEGAEVAQAPAPVGDPAQNRSNLQSLLDAGGIIEMQSGRYVIDQPLVISSHYTTLTGVSCGSGFDYQSGTVSGAVSTVICYDGTNCLNEILRVEGRNTEIRDLVLINGSDGGTDSHQLIEVKEKTCAIRNVRFVLYDERNWGVGGPPRDWADIMLDPNPTGIGATSGAIDDGCVFFNYRGDVRGLVDSCWFNTVSTGVRIGTQQNSDLDTDPVDPPVRQVRVENSRFKGFYAGEADRTANSVGSGRATGVVIYNGREVAVTGNHFESENRARRRLLNRSVLTFNSSTRNLYIANNVTRDCGSADWAPMANNQGEQYLFHYRYTKGGIFDVVSSGASSAVINKSVGSADVGYETRWWACDQRGGWVPDEVGGNDHWVAFITEGTGVGQYREVISKSTSGSQVTLGVNRPWRLSPDATSRICLYVPMRQIILYGNDVDCGNVANTKSHLVTLWNDNIDNVIRKNIGRNLSAGITINSCLWGPSAWNLVEENELYAMYPEGPDLTAPTNCFIAFQFATTRESAPGNTIWPTASWYGMGNIARHNQGSDAGAAMAMANSYYGHTYRHTDAYEDDESLIGKGMQLCVFEKNSFEDTNTGVLTDCSVHFGIVRENRFGGVSSNSFITIRSGHEYPKTQILDVDNHN